MSQKLQMKTKYVEKYYLGHLSVQIFFSQITISHNELLLMPNKNVEKNKILHLIDWNILI